MRNSGARRKLERVLRLSESPDAFSGDLDCPLRQKVVALKSGGFCQSQSIRHAPIAKSASSVLEWLWQGKMRQPRAWALSL